MSVRYETDGHVRIITIDRPEVRNAIDSATNQLLYEAWSDFRADPDAWVAIVTGAGDKVFCAGADLKELDTGGRNVSPHPRGIITRDFVCDKPMIAALNGAAFGGGLEMALGCDLRVAVETATLALSEARWALLPGGGGTQRLPRAIPVGVALQMMYTGEPISAARAYDLGLVNEVVPVGSALESARAIAAKITANGPLAVRAIKEAVRRGLEAPLSEGIRIEQDLANRVYLSDDAKEGPRAFREKRPPAYQGR